MPCMMGMRNNVHTGSFNLSLVGYLMGVYTTRAGFAVCVTMTLFAFNDPQPIEAVSYLLSCLLTTISVCMAVVLRFGCGCKRSV